MKKHFKYISEGLNLYTRKMMVSLILMVKSGGNEQFEKKDYNFSQIYIG